MRCFPNGNMNRTADQKKVAREESGRASEVEMENARAGGEGDVDGMMQRFINAGLTIGSICHPGDNIDPVSQRGPIQLWPCLLAGQSFGQAGLTHYLETVHVFLEANPMPPESPSTQPAAHSQHLGSSLSPMTQRLDVLSGHVVFGY